MDDCENIIMVQKMIETSLREVGNVKENKQEGK